MGKAKQVQNGISGARQNGVKYLHVTQLEPSNDAAQYVVRKKESTRKILTIAIMFLVIGTIVWSLG